MPTNILMPALSPTMEQGKLAKWLKKEGDTIKSGDVIAEIETDKATMEVEAVDEGVLAQILVPDGTENVAGQHADRGDRRRRRGRASAAAAPRRKPRPPAARTPAARSPRRVAKTESAAPVSRPPKSRPGSARRDTRWSR